ncbi:uncharacterized protein LOC134854252 isoform X2 [Symsagittifera roscoffensis]|uniref:uncharacterized protein LOC134854252 isoform X2 n=1 Tax=Symsagittifera roscoffensis TaxID=84072 RepID=UPI00307B521B
MPKQPSTPYDTWHAAKKHEKSRTYPFHNSKDDIRSNTLITDYQPEDVARQITLRDAEAFRQITESELRDYGKSKKNSVGIKACSSRFNQTMFWTRAEVLSSNDCKRRGYLLSFFIKVSKYLYAHANFQGFSAVVTALSSSPISRLKRSWEHVDKKDRVKFEKFAQCVNPESNYSNLRNLLPPAAHGNNTSQPVVPFLGMFLLELDYLQSVDQMKSRDHRNGRTPSSGTKSDGRVPNSDNQSSSTPNGDEKLCNIVNILMNYHRHALYDFEQNPQILNSIKSNTCLEELVKICEADQYKRSLELEPTSLFTSSPSGKTSCNQPPRPQTPNGTSNSYCSMHPPPTSTNSAHTSNSNYHSRNGVSGSIQFGLVGSSNGGKEKVVGLPPSGRGHRKSKSVGGYNSTAYGLSSSNPFDDEPSHRVGFDNPLPVETPPGVASGGFSGGRGSLGSAGGMNKLTSVVKTLTPLFASPIPPSSANPNTSARSHHRKKRSGSLSDDHLLLNSTDINDNEVTRTSTTRKEHESDAEDTRESIEDLFYDARRRKMAGVVAGNPAETLDFSSTYFSSDSKEAELSLNSNIELLRLRPSSLFSDEDVKEGEKFSGSLKKKLILNKGKRNRLGYWKKCWVSLNDEGVLSFYSHKTIHVPGGKESDRYHKHPTKRIDLSTDGWYVLRHGAKSFILTSDSLGKTYRFEAGEHVDKWTVELDACTDLIKLHDSSNSSFTLPLFSSHASESDRRNTLPPQRKITTSSSSSYTSTLERRIGSQETTADDKLLSLFLDPREDENRGSDSSGASISALKTCQRRNTTDTCLLKG